ncbi:MAG: phospholipase D-like domain-containing protein [Candidatus Shapirobacteria bacterium]|jgi:hypothetical protein|nr:phospholipase D-like domain-containing protein [Candidatus Shapirobacteria bacterium]MDD4382618.1 phospholipase D-like domain-containing protein [Candidatus Shapirobacteria bacterium]
MNLFNWFESLTKSKSIESQSASFILTDENSFYHRFTQDLFQAKQEVIIESPYITLPRLQSLKPFFEQLIRRGVKIFIITKNPKEHGEQYMADQSEIGIRYFESLGVQVLLCQNHHRKLAMIDRKIIWKGSLNILSQQNSREFMEREENKEKINVLFKFLQYDKIIF